MKYQRISNTSFERTSKRFLKIAKETINSFGDDDKFKERYDSEAIWNLKQIIKKLNTNYKKSPFKNKSSYDHKIECFSMTDILNRNLRIQYIFENSKLIFKLLTRNERGRYTRRCQFVLKI